MTPSGRFVPNPADDNDPGKVHYGFNDFSFPGTPPFNVGGETKSYSGVVRWPRKLLRLPRGTDFSVFYNRSQNFTPIGGRIDGYGNNIASPRGRTKEWGFNFSAFEEKITVRVNWFETAVQGQSHNPTVVRIASEDAIIGQAGIWLTEGTLNPHLYDVGVADAERLFSTLPANYRDLYAWRLVGTPPSISANRNSSLPGKSDTTDFTAKGTEIDLVMNPTRGWRMLVNVARQETMPSNALPFLKDLIARMTPVWNQLRARPRATYPTNHQLGNPLPSSSQTFGTWLDANVLVPFATAIATEGSASAEQRKWRANLVTNYSFGRDSFLGERLKGWSIGGALRWQDKIGIGYPTTRNPNGSVNLDLAHPYYSPAETNVDAFVSYERKVWSDRITWKAQFNVRNLIADDTPIAVGVQPWGAVSTARLAPERRWYLTNSFTF